MNNRMLLCITVVVLLVATSAAQADSPVWKITRGDRHLYLGGTIHVLSKADFPLPAAFENAYRAAAVIVFETDLRELQTPEFQQALVRQTTYPAGSDLTQFLQEATRQRLAQFLATRGISMDNLVKFKAGMVSITLTMIELQRLGVAGSGVDAFFSQRASDDRKKIESLESAEQQVAFIAAMGEGREDEMIAYTLREIENLPALLQTMKEAWRAGDNARLEAVALKPMDTDFPDLTDRLLADRNKAWLPKIEAMLETEAVELILVGALHLAGEDGLLALLKARGYTVEVQ